MKEASAPPAPPAPPADAAEPFASIFTKPALGRTVIRATLLYWSAIYALFTLRSIAQGRGHLLVQAGLRVLMMGVGLALCFALLRILRRMELPSWPRRFALFILLGLQAEFAYMLVNYVVFFEAAELWEPENGPVGKMLSYVVEFFWLFPAWLLLIEWVGRRHLRLHSRAEPAAEELWLGSRGHQVRVALAEILWVEAEGDYVRIHTGVGSHLHRATMRHMEQRLTANGFVRIHRRIIVAARLLESVSRSSTGRLEVTLSNGRELPVGRAYVASVRALTMSLA